MAPRLVPELDVSDLDRSLVFYTSILGFSLLYARPEERFTYLGLDGVHLMLEEAAGPGRRFNRARLERPYGRGVNFQIEVADVDTLYARVQVSNVDIVIPLEERWYRRDDMLAGNRQFVVADPDGYLLRFFSGLGSRPVESAAESGNPT
jgi:catechol 2,3-dioxygenase-like lactoylglutathione lyase family enzyme